MLFTPQFCVLYGAMQWCLSQSFTVSHCICFSSSDAVYSPVLCSVWCYAAMSVVWCLLCMRCLLQSYCKPLHFVSVLLVLFTPLFYVLYGATQRWLSCDVYSVCDVCCRVTVSHYILFQFFCCCLLPCSVFCMVLCSDVCCVMFTPLLYVLYGAMQRCLSCDVYSSVLCSVWCYAAMSVSEFYCKPLYFVSVLLVCLLPCSMFCMVIRSDVCRVMFTLYAMSVAELL